MSKSILPHSVEMLVHRTNPMIGGSLVDAAYLVSDALDYLSTVTDNPSCASERVMSGRRVLLDCCAGALRYHLDQLDEPDNRESAEVQP